MVEKEDIMYTTRPTVCIERAVVKQVFFNYTKTCCAEFELRFGVDSLII